MDHVAPWLQKPHRTHRSGVAGHRASVLHCLHIPWHSACSFERHSYAGRMTPWPIHSSDAGSRSRDTSNRFGENEHDASRMHGRVGRPARRRAAHRMMSARPSGSYPQGENAHLRPSPRPEFEGCCPLAGLPVVVPGASYAACLINRSVGRSPLLRNDRRRALARGRDAPVTSIIVVDPWSFPDTEVRRELRSAERSTLRAA